MNEVVDRVKATHIIHTAVDRRLFTEKDREFSEVIDRNV